MANQYQLTCECGASFPVDSTQAGREISCSCGKILYVPSMRNIKKLPVWNPGSSAKSPLVSATQAGEMSTTQASATPPVSIDSENAAVASSLTNHPKKTTSRNFWHALNGKQRGILIVVLLLVLFFGSMTLYYWYHPVSLLDVFNKRRSFINENAVVQRDSSPVTREDVEFFLVYEFLSNRSYVISDDIIDRMPISDAYYYFSVLKNGLDLSDNFYENYNELKTLHLIKLIGSLVLFVLCLTVLCILPWTLPKKNVSVGAQRGSEWK